MSDRVVRVLLVEDNPLEAELVRATLAGTRNAAYRVEHVDTLTAGLARLGQEGGFDAALLDFNLPDSSGLDTFRAAHAAAPALPILILTNLDDEEAALTAVREGAQDYLLKADLDGALLHRAIGYAIERTRAEHALRESEERYALAVAGAHDGLWDWDLGNGRAYFSPRWHALLGFDAGELAESPDEWLARIHPDDAPAFQAALRGHLEGRSEHFQHEHRIARKDGSWVWVLSRGLAVRDAAGIACRMAGSMTDVSRRKATEAQLLHDAMHDALTGLPNRALFVDRLDLELGRRQRRPGGQFAVLFLDLDRFKNVNDSLGHGAGDRLLVAIAARLTESIRPGDTVARLGGDEFALLLQDVADGAHASQVAERLQTLLHQPFEVEGHEVFMSASIGIALTSTGYHGAQEMLRDADIAMYRAKAAGKARYEIFDRAMHASAVALLRLETELRRAVERSEFEMHYQPIVALEHGTLVGFEALVRWRHPSGVLRRPQTFLAVAEETGLIVPIGWWALEQACAQTARWQGVFPAMHALTVSVNISGKLLQKDVVARLRDLLGVAGLAPECLRLEITESIVLDHGEDVLARLAEIRRLGVQLHVDDFGTGYSSLSYLQRFPYDSLKIDRSFISDLDREGGSQAIVQTIVALGSNLAMNVIAEGIETAEQLRHLREIRCPQGQGYWFSRPVDAEAAADLLAHPRTGWDGDGAAPPS
jgi:diguanylate cyclase (GGDEF)-like protein/PAS domain S-box-containing protein